MSNNDRLELDHVLDDVPIRPAPIEALLASGWAAKRRRQRTLIGGATAATALVLGGGVLAAQAYDPSGSRGGLGDPATQPTASTNDQVSAYESLHQKLRESHVGETDVNAETAEEANRALGFDDDNGLRYLTYGNDSSCVTDGVAVLSFVYWGDGAAQLYTDASSTPGPKDCATVDYDDPIPAEVRVAFRIDPETYEFRLEKGRDLVSEAMVDDIEGR